MFSVLPDAFISCAILIGISALAMLLTVHPGALVLSSIHTDISALAMHFVIQPVAFLGIATDMDIFSLTILKTILEVAFVALTIRTEFHTTAIWHALEKLSSVFGSPRQSYLLRNLVSGGLFSLFWLLCGRLSRDSSIDSGEPLAIWSVLQNEAGAHPKVWRTEFVVDPEVLEDFVHQEVCSIT